MSEEEFFLGDEDADDVWGHDDPLVGASGSVRPPRKPGEGDPEDDFALPLEEEGEGEMEDFGEELY